VLPVVVRCVAERRTAATALLQATRKAGPGEAFTAAGVTLVRSIVEPRSGAGKVWAHDPAESRRRDLVREEDHAFWAWAIVEVLRATGIFSRGPALRGTAGGHVCAGRTLPTARSACATGVVHADS
jgi:hypothetical protein